MNTKTFSNFNAAAEYDFGILVLQKPNGDIDVAPLMSPSVRRAPSEEQIRDLVYRSHQSVMMDELRNSTIDRIVSVVDVAVKGALQEAMRELATEGTPGATAQDSEEN